MECPSCGGACTEGQLRLRREIGFCLFAVGLVLAWFLTGSLLHDFVEGLDRTLLPMWKVWLPVGVLAIAVVLLRARWQRAVCEKCGVGAPSRFLVPVRVRSTQTETSPSRRRVLRALGTGGVTVAAAAAGGAVVIARNRGWLPVANDFFLQKVENTSPTQRSEWRGSTVAAHRRLGRTNVMVSDISLGSGRITDVAVAKLALDRGINYFDTAPDYAGTGSERILGEALKGHRDEVFLATKFCRSEGHLPNDTPVPEIIRAVEDSLRRLRTDYVDLIHIHSCDRVDRLLAPNIHQAFDRLKEQGKVRFLGFSSHTPNLERVANAAIDSGRFDVMMLAYHYGMWPHFGEVLQRAHEHDMGVVAMKTLKGAKHTNLAEFRDEASSYAQSAFRWVLSNPNVSCLVISFFLPQHVDEYLYASGSPVRPSDVARLHRYDELIAGDYCQPHCGTCLKSCVARLPINDVLRYRMYFKDYGWEKEGMQRYARLEQNAALCRDCAAPCAGSCPIGVSIRENMLDADRVLRFPV